MATERVTCETCKHTADAVTYWDGYDHAAHCSNPSIYPECNGMMTASKYHATHRQDHANAKGFPVRNLAF